MRGKAKAVRRKRTVSGITPAYAGKRPVDPFQDIIARDHPRLCGEKLLEQLPEFDLMGSPPPMRGKVRRLSN